MIKLENESVLSTDYVVDPKGFEPSSGLSSHRIVRLHLLVDCPQFKQIRTFPLLISFFLTLENTSMNNWSKYVI